VSVVSGHGSGVLVASGRGGTIAINTTVAPATALVDRTSVPLGPGEVRVRVAPGAAAAHR
jgi:hypothetical protein